MAPAVVSLLLLDFYLTSAAQVFLPSRRADGVLGRHKRYNSGLFEELLEGNLERECMEEKCDLEEAREYFENDEKTMKFWSGYMDGNQCASSPCLNQGSCRDHVGYYTCSCVSGFTGMSCEIVMAKRCDVNNGGCMHFCESVGTFGAKCSCASGYKLMQDGLRCEAEDEFACGRTVLTRVSAVRSFHFNISETKLTNVTSTTSSPSTPPSPTPPLAQTNDSWTTSAEQLLLGAAVQTEGQPTPFKRIVGGKNVLPGEIPWQAALVAHPSGQAFCGGSILRERWVITAAHCLLEAQGSFVVRVGEYNLDITEGTEQDIEVLHQHVHPRYNATRSLHNHDIALLHLKTPISFSTIVRPICIGPLSFIEALVQSSSPATVSGWGRTRYLGSTASILQKVEAPFTDRTECKRSSSSPITSVMFCAGFHNEPKDACQGDSGGPHASRFHDTWFLTGIVSWGEECARKGKYGVYTRLSIYYRWMNHVMGRTKRRLWLDVDYLEAPDP